MYAYVKYRDGQRDIVETSKIKNFQGDNISYTKKYKMLWEEKWYDGIIITVGDTEADVEQKIASKRLTVPLMELCDSVPESDNAANNEKLISENDKLKTKELLEAKVERATLKLQTDSNSNNVSQQVDESCSKVLRSGMKRQVNANKTPTIVEDIILEKKQVTVSKKATFTPNSIPNSAKVGTLERSKPTVVTKTHKQTAARDKDVQSTKTVQIPIVRDKSVQSTTTKSTAVKDKDWKRTKTAESPAVRGKNIPSTIAKSTAFKDKDIISIKTAKSPAVKNKDVPSTTAKSIAFKDKNIESIKTANSPAVRHKDVPSTTAKSTAVKDKGIKCIQIAKSPAPRDRDLAGITAKSAAVRVEDVQSTTVKNAAAVKDMQNQKAHKVLEADLSSTANDKDSQNPGKSGEGNEKNIQHNKSNKYSTVRTRDVQITTDHNHAVANENVSISNVEQTAGNVEIMSSRSRTLPSGYVSNRSQDQNQNTKKSANPTEPTCPKNCTKKLKDLARELDDIKKANVQLKRILEDTREQLREISQLNLKLQNDVINSQSSVTAELEMLKIFVEDVGQRQPAAADPGKMIGLPVGYRRLDKNLIHLGHDVWILITQYDSIATMSGTSAKFVKNMAIAVFGTPTLQNSSVTGKVSNRIRNSARNVEARPQLNGTKMVAIKDILRYWLTVEKGQDEVSVDLEVQLVGTHISHKIYELNRKPKEPVIRLEVADAEPEDVPESDEELSERFPITELNDSEDEGNELGDDDQPNGTEDAQSMSAKSEPEVENEPINAKDDEPMSAESEPEVENEHISAKDDEPMSAESEAEDESEPNSAKDDEPMSAKSELQEMNQVEGSPKCSKVLSSSSTESVDPAQLCEVVDENDDKEE